MGDIPRNPFHKEKRGERNGIEESGNFRAQLVDIRIVIVHELLIGSGPILVRSAVRVSTKMSYLSNQFLGIFRIENRKHVPFPLVETDT